MKARQAKSDLDLLQGAWRLSSLEVDGEDMPPDMLSACRVKIRGSRFRSLGMGAEYIGTVTLDSSARPKAFDLAYTRGPEKGNTNRGIYEIEPDGWRLCLAMRGDTRPNEFAARKGTGRALETLRKDGVAPEAGKTARAPAPAACASPTELEGEWALVSGFLNGKPMDVVTVRYGVRSFHGNRTVLKFGPQTYIDAVFTLDSSQSPRAIDYSHTKGMYAGKTQLGIYECDGATLKLSTAPPGEARATDFAGRGANTVTVFRKKG